MITARAIGVIFMVEDGGRIEGKGGEGSEMYQTRRLFDGEIETGDVSSKPIWIL